LWAVHGGLTEVPAPPPPGRVAVAVDPAVPDGYYGAIGYRVLGTAAVRVDMLERFAAELRKLAHHAPFALAAPVSSMLGLPPDRLAGVVIALGYAEKRDGAAVTYTPERRAKPQRRPHRSRDDASPFAALRKTLIA
jgi:ATP-dependent RNA helicase SUPV3L1/SUV3